MGGGKLKGLAAERVGRLGNHGQNCSLRGFPQNAGGFAVLVAVNLAPLWIAGGKRDATQLQSPSIRHANVAIDSNQKDRMPSRYFVQIPAGWRHLDWPECLIPA